MDIVDAQLHFGPAGKGYGHGPLEVSPSIIDSALEAMDSVGIRSAIIDEYWFWVAPPKEGQTMPGFELPNGAWRNFYPLAQLASILHPERFCFFVRVDREDPDLESVVRVLAATPQVKALRMLPVWNGEEAECFMKGGYDEAFAIAESTGLPLCMPIPGYVEYLPCYLKKFPKLQFIVDHWGMAHNYNQTGRPEAELLRTTEIGYLDEIMKLGEYPNIAMKISHAHSFFKDTEYPFKSIVPLVRRAIENFGIDRIVWSTDKTVAFPLRPWAELLYYLKDSPDLSQEEKEKILGKNARRIYKWPLPAA